MSKNKGITVKKSDNFSQWYTELIEQAELADTRYGIKGFVVYREAAQFSIDKIFQLFENSLQSKEHLPLGFPAVIPEKNFLLEKDHVEGFSPEVFWLESQGDEKMALRPTSETAFHQMYSLWIRSHRDLPYKRYQRANVFRNEKTKSTRPFLRGREFHWIETHCAFANETQARAQVEEDMQTTQEILTEKLGIPHIFFERPQWDKFPGALSTYAADALMGSGKVLQLPSTHLLGTGFSKAFDMTYQSEEGENKYCNMTCYGPAVSRIFGGLISLHSDDKGLRIPFELSMKQIAIIPIKHEKNEAVAKKCQELKIKLRKYRPLLMDDLNQTPGYKFNEAELKGIPIRIEIGPKDLEKNSALIFRRDTETKETVALDNIEPAIQKIANEYTQNLKKQASQNFEESIKKCSSKTEVIEALSNEKIAKINISSIGLDLKEKAQNFEKEVGAEIRGVKLTKEKVFDNCIITKEKAKYVAYIARSY